MRALKQRSRRRRGEPHLAASFFPFSQHAFSFRLSLSAFLFTSSSCSVINSGISVTPGGRGTRTRTFRVIVPSFYFLVSIENAETASRRPEKKSGSSSEFFLFSCSLFPPLALKASAKRKSFYLLRNPASLSLPLCNS